MRIWRHPKLIQAPKNVIAYTRDDSFHFGEYYTAVVFKKKHL